MKTKDDKDPKSTKKIKSPAVPEPLEIAVNTSAVTTKFNAVLQDIGKVEPKLPAGILIPALTGDPAAEIPGAEPEPVYDLRARANIQGNTIPGFNKDHQHFLFFRIRDVRRAKLWLRWIAPLISSMEEVLTWVRAFRALRKRLGAEPPTCATWVNIAFSSRAIELLTSKADAAAFGDQSFRQGLAARSTYLGDPSNTKHPGHRHKWVVGGPKNEADILVIVAADDSEDLVALVNTIKARASASNLRLVFEQRGDNLPGALRGHEHFGFKDGVSQPGVRGKVSAAPGDFITPRYIDHTDARARIFAKPGQLLLWPGQFLLGEPRQNPEHPFNSAPAAPAAPPAPAPPNYPAWAALGSYLVCRRLRQDVPAFWKFAVAAASVVGLSAEKFASMLVGRWPSGAPIMRVPGADDPLLAGDEWANNHFIFNDSTRPSVLRPIPGYGGDPFPQAVQDMLGNVCPHFAHIRKTNPRDISTDLGKPHDSMLRMILRRGIPFGPPIVGIKKPSKKLLKQERGLIFICYGSTIEDQFELLTRRWANSPIQPNFGGHDPIIGQRDERGARARFIDFPTASGSRRIRIKDEWVIPTGGGYFFSPPIEAIAGVLGA
ncbi:MAG TPA: Dyp-type peroxidase [Pyrinomonadaceae bacterium]|nr:Dyp-type peroxidase [Pyrinomonadaceae bacterium]